MRLLRIAVDRWRAAVRIEPSAHEARGEARTRVGTRRALDRGAAVGSPLAMMAVIFLILVLCCLVAIWGMLFPG